MTNKTPIVNTNSGPVKGLKQKTCFGDEFWSFQKIPFAKPATGELRFKDPVPIEPWKEPLDATAEGPVAFSFNTYVYSVVGAEDCLHLNIFTKNIHPKSLTPVMVYIHGGAFNRGSSSVLMYGPDYLLQKNVIFVSFNYRLGSLGFLRLADKNLKVTGNAGLKDQVLALKWINENISHFGGDNNKITLFGESAGAASVHYHMASEQSKGLFNRAILMSGCLYNNWALNPDLNWAKRLAAKLGYEGDDDEKQILEFLQKIEADKIILAQMRLKSDEENLDQIMEAMVPMMESDATDGFLCDDPKKMIKKSWGNNIDIMIGGCSNEGLIYYKDINEKLLAKHSTLEHFVPREIRGAKSDGEVKAAALALLNHYFKGNSPSMETFDQFIELIGDSSFWHGFHRALISRLKYANNAKTYLYRFDIVSDTQNHHKLMCADASAKGACHADDKSFLFKTALGHVPTSGSKEHQAIQKMVSLFTTFAITGNPNSIDYGVTNWESIQTEDFECLNMTINKFEVIKLPESQRMKVWDEIFKGIELV